MWENCGMARNKEDLTQAIADISALRAEFYAKVRVPGRLDGYNPELDKAGRVADLLELGELMCKDALEREESCGGHFREEHQTEEGEALRRDDEFTFVSAWAAQRRAQGCGTSQGGPGLREHRVEATELQITRKTQIMNLTLKVWRQDGPQDKGHLETHQLSGVTGDMSFLEMMDVLNDKIIREGGDPIAFDHDCREGICGMCSMFINGEAHGPGRGVTTCQLHMRSFKDGDTITIEPWRASAFPVVKDLAVDRGAFDRIIQAGGYVSVNTSGETLDANAIPIPKADADEAFNAATCIGCGACVATCKNASAMLFVSAKVSQFALLPQGQPERKRRVTRMVEQMDKEGFGNCTNTGACAVECPKGIDLTNIARMNRDFLNASVTGE